MNNRNNNPFVFIVAGALCVIAILIGIGVLTSGQTETKEPVDLVETPAPETITEVTGEPLETTENQSEEVSSEVQTTEQGALNTGILRSIAVGTAEIAQETVQKFFHRWSIDVDYPEQGVKGAYMSAYGIVHDELRASILDLIDNTDLNALVIDYKTDDGVITGSNDSTHQWVQENTDPIVDYESIMKTLEEHNVYAIARVVAFKDTIHARKHPDKAFTSASGELWYARGSAYINPFLKENWDYLVEVGRQAAIAGFHEIQFDYVRFPESFGYHADSLYYDQGEYANMDLSEGEKRVQVIADFLAYAREELHEYDVDVSADVFGYIVDVEREESIGQQFDLIAKNVDVISSMIYPSHWGPGYFGFDKPDLNPYGVIVGYLNKETPILNSLEKPPITRPWIQDFTASYLGSGNYIPYGAAEVQAQVQALRDHGITEFLLWNAGNRYTTGVNYSPPSDTPLTNEPQTTETSEAQTTE